MAGGIQVGSRADARIAELIREVDTLRSFVVYSIGRRHSLDPDDVMQQIRESVWRRSSTYDPKSGTPNAFVFGVARNVLRNELRRHIPLYMGHWDQFESLVQPDALTLLIERYDVGRWMKLVAEFVPPRDWAVVGEIALADGDAERVGLERDLSIRSVRTIRDRVFLTASTVRAALAAVDADLPMTGPVIVRCIPDQGGIREVARMLGDSSEAIAKKLDIHPGSARARIAQAKRLVYIAHTVMRQEQAA
ncbi:DNA-directed RNA polymerase specialized sigma24 family protein [Leifsonia sp. EB41]|uniref:RNA polymerase sigma factor n=1 Tax=Leifsonia sp. EB41 TaxID=3156260 RepID=UPI003514508F